MRKAKNEMRHTKKEQEVLYDKHVLSRLVRGDDHNEIGDGYQEYLKEIEGFHALAFDQVIDHLLEDNDDVLDKFTSRFESIPEYLVHRSGWQEKINDVMRSEDASHFKTESVAAMDRTRTRAHDGVINLFNKLNSYAEEKNLPLPYPMSYGEFDKDNLNHRADVADILTKHSPLLEKVNMVVQKKFQETGRTETQAEKYQKMSLGDLMALAKENAEQKDLTDLENNELSM